MRKAAQALPPTVLEGADGESAYEIARRHGFVGSEVEWLAHLRTAKDGRDGRDGTDGRNGVDGLPGADGRDGKAGDPGMAGERGEPGFDGWTPISALVEDGQRVVMQIVDWAGGSGEKPQRGLYVGPAGFVTQRSEATNLRGPGGERVPTWIGGGGVSEARVLELIGASGGADADSITVTYVSSSDNRPARVVRDDDEDRFDWGTGDPGTYQYKGTAAAGTSTAADSWTVYRTTLDGTGRPVTRVKATGAWDDRETLLWP